MFAHLHYHGRGKPNWGSIWVSLLEAWTRHASVLYDRHDRPISGLVVCCQIRRLYSGRTGLDICKCCLLDLLDAFRVSGRDFFSANNTFHSWLRERFRTLDGPSLGSLVSSSTDSWAFMCWESFALEFSARLATPVCWAPLRAAQQVQRHRPGSSASKTSASTVFQGSSISSFSCLAGPAVTLTSTPAAVPYTPLPGTDRRQRSS